MFNAHQRFEYPENEFAKVGDRVMMPDLMDGLVQGTVVEAEEHNDGVLVKWDDGDETRQYISDMRLLGRTNE